MRKYLVFLTVLGLIVVFANPALAQDPLPEWHQSFDQSTDGWITDETPGEEGWCGDIEQVDQGSGPVMPSAGTGYAVVEHGACNDYWTENGFPDGSGPYAPFGGYSESWPDVTELDIYLDPSWEVGTSFTYAVSVRLLDVETFADSFRYLSMLNLCTNEKTIICASFQHDSGLHLSVP